MQKPSNDVFSRPAFSRDQNREIGARHPLQLLAHVPHGGRLAKNHRFGRELLDRDRAFVVRASQ